VKKVHKLVLILLVVFAQVIWLGWPRLTHGSVVEESYRRTERLEAHKELFIHPSEATKAAAHAEDERLYNYIKKRNAVIVLALLIVNGIGIYYFLNYGNQKKLA